MDHNPFHEKKKDFEMKERSNVVRSILENAVKTNALYADGKIRYIESTTSVN